MDLVDDRLLSPAYPHAMPMVALPGHALNIPQRGRDNCGDNMGTALLTQEPRRLSAGGCSSVPEGHPQSGQ